MQKTAFFVVIAALPGLYSWLGGRALAERLDDPVLPERLAAHQQRITYVTVAAWLVTPLLVDGWWPFFAVLASMFAGGFPLRRRLREETWSLPEYFFWLLRVWIAFGAFWTLLALAPYLVLDHGGAGSPTSWILLVLLIVWQAVHWRVAFFVLRARPLDDPELLVAFEEVRARSKVPRVDVWVAGEEGARYVQALALPGIRRQRSFFWPDLLRLLDCREAAGVFAHEVAHLEEHTPTKVAWKEVLVAGAAVVGCLLLPAYAAASDREWLISAWTLLVFLWIYGSTVSRTKHESDSDRRAIELCGDPEALARGLEKLTTALRIPRRWTAAQRASATHPDLAERLRAIRESSAPPDLHGFEPVAVRLGTNAVVFTSTQVHWLDGLVTDDLALAAASPHSAASSVTSLPVREFVQLELVAKGRATPVLRARHLSGRRWKVAIAEADIARVQRALERLPHPEWSSSASPTSAFFLGFAALLVFRETDGPSASILAILLAAFIWSRASLTAAALAVLAHALLAHVVGDPGSPGLIVAAASLGVAAFRERGRAEAPVPKRTLWIVTATACVALGILWHAGWTVASSSDAPRVVLRDALRAMPGTVVFPIFIGVTLALLAQRWLRVLAAASMAVTAVTLWLASDQAIRGEFSAPLEVELPALEHVETTALVEREVELEGRAGTVKLWPDAEGFAVDLDATGDGHARRAHARGMDRRMKTFHVERAGAAYEVRAIELALVEHGRMLVVRSSEGKPEVALLDNDGSETIWRAPVPTRRIASFFADRSGSWQFTGPPYKPTSMIVTSGTTKGPVLSSKDWNEERMAVSDDRTVVEGVATVATAIRLEKRVDYPPYRSFAAFLLGSSFSVERVTITPLVGEHRAPLVARGEVDCVPVDVGSEELVCRTYRDDQTRFWIYEPKTGVLSGAGSVRGWSWELRRTSERRLVATMVGGKAALVDAKAKRLHEIDLGLPCGSGLTAFDTAGERFATVEVKGGKSVVRLYEIRPAHVALTGS